MLIQKQYSKSNLLETYSKQKAQQSSFIIEEAKKKQFRFFGNNCESIVNLF